jgi:small conductance mechanosensitive channel
MTGIVLLLFGIDDSPAQEAGDLPSDSPAQDTASDAANPGVAIEEATGTLRQLAQDFTGVLPKVVIAILLLVAAAVLVKVLRVVIRRTIGRWERAAAISALTGAVVWLTAIGVAMSVIAGDARALVGSVGLLGLALSWALQAPIESFAGWLLNSFQGYYRVGDRIEVGEVFGDVYRVDALTTTVWEAGGPDKPVHGAQPTGALITFPNSEVLRANIINYTRGFPYVWDEVTVGISNESDIAHAMHVVATVATRVVGEAMRDPVTRYRALLERENLAYDVADEPQVYLAPTESWMDLTVRYLVAARERRKWSSLLHREIHMELAKPENASRIKGSYPVTRVTLDPKDET